MKKQKKKLFPEYNDEVNNTMDAVMEYVASTNGGQVPPKDMMILTKLGDLLYFYNMVKDFINQNGITQVGPKGNIQKSEFLKSATELLVQIMKIADCYGLTMKSARKMSETEPTDNFTELMESLNEN